MKILDLKKVTIILVTMLLFLNMQISVFASDNCTVVKIPVRQIFDSEVEGIADEFSYIMTTDQSGAPMPAGGRNMQDSINIPFVRQLRKKIIRNMIKINTM